MDCSCSTPPLLLSPHAVQEKQQLEKETGLKIVEAGVSDVSHTHPKYLLFSCVCERASVGVLVISCVFCVWAHGTGITRWFQLVLASVSHLQLQLCSQMLIFSSDEFQTHILLSVLLWLPWPVFVSFTSLKAVVSMAKRKHNKTKAWCILRNLNEVLIIAAEQQSPDYLECCHFVVSPDAPVTYSLGKN